MNCQKLHITCIERAKRFSPNSVENDHLILEETAALLTSEGAVISWLTEEELLAGMKVPSQTDALLCMARSQEAIDILRHLTCPVINSLDGICLCGNRKALLDLQRKRGISAPPENGEYGVWLKRSVGTAEVAEDILFCATKAELQSAMQSFQERGITEISQQAHVPGDLIKFYGVASTPFFYLFYPTDTGRSKFGSESHNGEAHHYPFSEASLKKTADDLAFATGTPVYGGDAIVRDDGTFVLIDFNDWPSFSPCREDACRAVVTLLKKILKKEISL